MNHRKPFFILLGFVLCVFALSAFAGTETAVRDADRTGIELFDGLWAMERAEVRIRYRDGRFCVRVTVWEDEENWTEWYYECAYDARTQSLVCEDRGTKILYAYDDTEDAVRERTASTDSSAVFRISAGGQLFWTDEDESAGEPLLFSRTGNFEGTWECDDTVIRFDAYEESYRCMISRKTGEDISEEWICWCEYEQDTCRAVCRDSVRKYILHGRIVDDETSEPPYDGEIYSEDIYDDGTAAFHIDDDGCLTWYDGKENAGDGMLFVRTAGGEWF